MQRLVKQFRQTIGRYFHDSWTYILLILLLVAALAFRLPFIALGGLLGLGWLIFRDVRSYRDRTEALMEREEKEIEEFDSVTKYAIFHMPYPMAMLDERGVITWQNSPFTKITGDVASGSTIQEVIPAVKPSDLANARSPFVVSFKDRIYRVRADEISARGKGDRYILFLQDVTDVRAIERAYDRESLAVMLLFVDNLDEVKASGDEQFRTKIQSVVDTTITNYFTNYQGVVRKYESDKYLVLLDRENFGKIQAKKFDILDIMREFHGGNSIPLTLSMGVSDIGATPLERYAKARAATDIALGRGGDQAVCVRENGYDYFGGKTKAVQKRTKVKARVIGYALRQIIDDAPNIFISGHKNPDMDAIGSAIGMLAAVRLRGKDARLILGDDTTAISSILSMMHDQAPDIKERIISPREAENAYRPGDLLILCDHHKPSLSPSRALSEMADNVVIIDHHRRADEFIKNPALVYLEPHASSASELVAEILQYMIEEKSLSKFEASAMLAGIMLDTKNFTVQTGIRTFEAASLLLRFGADPEEVKMLFRDDFETFVSRARAVETAHIYRDRFALAEVEGEGGDAILTAAQVSDALLSIDGVDASFALAKVDGAVHVSARSTGKVSVQLIMESLGGGGHIAQAGGRLAMTMDEARTAIQGAIDAYVKEETK